jgi:hypothetical protein
MGTNGDNRLHVPVAILGIMLTLTVVCIGAVVRDKVAIARLEEQVITLRERVSHLETISPQGWREP